MEVSRGGFKLFRVWVKEDVLNIVGSMDFGFFFVILCVWGGVVFVFVFIVGFDIGLGLRFIVFVLIVVRMGRF